jgi:phage terminase large subunit GpA-like protein
MSRNSSKRLANPSQISQRNDREKRLIESFRLGFRPPPRISIPEWADRTRIKPRGAGSTAGAWRTSDVEIARGPMLAATEPGVHIISCMVATQLLKTSLIENVFGFHADLDPAPMMIVQPKDDSAEAFSKERIGPFINATPALRKIVGTGKTRNSEETIDYKAFPGGFLALVGAGSPDNLARRPLRIILYDEVDKYPITREGYAIDIGDERLASYANWLSIRVCSPTVKGESNIEKSWLESDQRRASVACPHCSHRQFLNFRDHVEWDKTDEGRKHLPDTAAVHCEGCGAQWSEAERRRALATIRWHQTRPFECCGDKQIPLERYASAWRNGQTDALEQIWDWWASNRYAVYRAKCCHCSTWAVSNEHAGFQASKLYSPWDRDRPSQIARKWLAAQGDEDKLQVWWNTQAALPYKRNVAAEVSIDALAARCEVWEAEVPDGVALLTAGIDVQDYRVEIEIAGWGRNEESWSIDYHVIDGEMSHPDTQARIDEYLSRIWHRADGRPFAVRASCIDSGGHHTDAVYNFAKNRLGQRVWAIKGESARTGFTNPVWPIKRPTSRTKKSYRPTIIGVNAGKDFISHSLAKSKPGPGYMHFNVQTDIVRFSQLTAEEKVWEGHGSQRRRKWVPKAGRANEALDCRVYAYAALHGLMHVFNLKLNRLADEVGASETFISRSSEIPQEPAARAASPQLSAGVPPEQTITIGTPPTPPKRQSLGSRLARRN